MNKDSNQFSRANYRAKRKKTNLILNSLIVIVLLLIIVVAYNIFAPGGEKAAPKKETPKTEAKQEIHNSDQGKEKAEEASAMEGSSTQEEDQSDQSDQKEETSVPAAEGDPVVTEGGSTPNVVKTVENPNWKPVGTTQTGEHTTVYDQNSVDWKEMLNAISYATDLPVNDMTVFWISRDKEVSDGVRGTVYSKNTDEKYRVFLQWIDGEGWKPTKVEELAELEK